jgi:hypothetical protein
MHHGGIVPGGCAYALDVLCQNTSFTAQLRTERGGLRAPRGKRGSQGRSRRGAQISAQGFHAQVRCTTGGKRNQPINPACPMVQGPESGCWTALPRVAKPSRGCRMVRRASHREHAETARPAVGTAQAGCLACTHRRPGRRPRPPRGGRDCRIAREGMGLVFLCFSQAPKKSISTRRWIPTRCERVWYSKQGTKKLNA